MKCPYCGDEFSDKAYDQHVPCPSPASEAAAIARSVYKALGLDYGGGEPTVWEITSAASSQFARLRYSGTRQEVVAALEAQGFTAPDFQIEAMTDQIDVWRVKPSGRRRRAFTLMP